MWVDSGEGLVFGSFSFVSKVYWEFLESQKIDGERMTLLGLFYYASTWLISYLSLSVMLKNYWYLEISDNSTPSTVTHYTDCDMCLAVKVFKPTLVVDTSILQTS